MFPFPLWWTFSQLQAKDELEKRQNDDNMDLSFLDAFNESSDSDDDFS